MTSKYTYKLLCPKCKSDDITLEILKKGMFVFCHNCKKKGYKRAKGGRRGDNAPQANLVSRKGA